MNYNGRFFAFGCSFTASSDRPTWADIVGRHFAEYQNWGRGGMGNQYIFYQLVEANRWNKFTPDDTVMIMWSSISRIDLYLEEEGEWHGRGSVFNSDLFSREFLKKFATDRFFLLRDLATISATIDLLKYWGVNYRMMSIVPIGESEVTGYKQTGDNKGIYHLYEDAIGEILPSVYEVIFNSNDWNLKSSNFGKYISPGQRDPHPDPCENLQYVKTVLPELMLKPEIVEWVENFKLGDKNPEYFHVQRF